MSVKLLHGDCRQVLRTLPDASVHCARWVDGVPWNMAAAALDADEWLALIERLNDAGRWPLSESDSRAKLAACRRALQMIVAHGAGAASPTVAQGGEG